MQSKYKKKYKKINKKIKMQTIWNKITWLGYET